MNVDFNLNEIGVILEALDNLEEELMVEVSFLDDSDQVIIFDYLNDIRQIIMRLLLIDGVSYPSMFKERKEEGIKE